MVDIADLMDKAIILLMASSGMRLSAVPPLNIKEITPIEYEALKLLKIIVYKKTNKQYHCFCTPESRKAIHEYLSCRERCGERLVDNSPLFRKHFNKYNSIQVAHPLPIATSTIKYLIKELLNKTGIRPP